MKKYSLVLALSCAMFLTNNCQALVFTCHYPGGFLGDWSTSFPSRDIESFGNAVDACSVLDGGLLSYVFEWTDYFQW